MQYILTTVGLSFLTNGLKDIFKASDIYANSNKQENEIDKEFIAKFEIKFEKLKNEILAFDSEKLQKLSAELNALLRYNRFEKNDIYKLLCTDTYLGRKSAELIENYLKSRNLNVSIYQPKDLKTSEIESFHIALTDMVKDLSEELQGYKDSGYEIVFNLTGGFKSVNSFLQTMASLYADKSLYIFESSNELLTIPRIPIKVDEKIIIKNIQIFRALELNILQRNKELENFPKTLILNMGNEYTLSAWGEIVWQKVKIEFYKNELIEPLQKSKIEYSKEFKKDFQKLNQKEKLQLNKSIVKLEQYIAHGKNLKSLRYHDLKGEVAQNYSHEFYPFDGNDSRRVYCNEKDKKIILQKIDAHLK